MSDNCITLAVCDQIATLTLNRPERLNACATDMADAIASALHALGDARVLVITGAGRAFCAGADLQAVAGASIAGGDLSHAALNTHFNPMMRRLAALNLPVISAVNGAAAGIGCSIALAADFVIAAQSAYFLQAFINIGLVPDGGASWTLPRLIGKSRATEMMMLGEKISAEKAAEWGLIYKTVADDQLAPAVLALATRLAAMPTVALGLMRQNIAAAAESTYALTLSLEAESQRIAGNSNDAHEGRTAFLAKRKPTFTGR